MNTVKTLDQQRAAHAWDVVEKIKSKAVKDKDLAKEFGSQAKKLPTRIMAAGLGQALAFLMAKSQGEGQKKQGLRDLQEALTSWMATRRKPKDGEEKTLLVRLLHGNADFQRYATAECLAYLVWLVRFADAAGLTDSTDSADNGKR